MKKPILRIAVFLTVMLVAGSCGEQMDQRGDVLQMDQPYGLDVSMKKFLAVTDLQDRATEALFRNPEVVGTGTGADLDGNPTIVVYTLREVEQRPDINLENVGAGQRPTALPVSIDKVPVVVKVTGMFKAYADPTAKFPRPVPIGVSTGHPDITAGTIGCRVVDASGNVYALSNNHVYANVNKATIGDNVLQPGSYDGGTDPGDAIGTLYDFEVISFSENNTMDAAIAISSTGNLNYSTPGTTVGDGYGTPSSTTITASIGMKVQKYGRTTGHTFGEIAEVNVTVDVCYETRGPFNCSKSARFVDQVTITPGTFSGGGDSGSLIVTDDGTNKPVALLFAGSTTRTIGSPIGVVLTRFGVTVDDGSGSGGGGEPGNQAPVADFTYAVADLTASFTDQSSDADGSVVSWNWNFGDGSNSTAQNPSNTYAAGGTYTVALTVTDNKGATGSTSQAVTVTDPNSGSGIVLTAAGYKVRGMRYVDLSWTGTSGTVDIYRNGQVIATSSGGAYTDNLGRNSGTFVYQVCEASVCSNQESVVF